MDELYEQLVDIEHQRWSSWMIYQFSLCLLDADGSTVIPAKYVHRWRRQIITDYKDLSESEKDSDREQVDRYWPLIQKELAQKEARIRELEGAIRREVIDMCNACAGLEEKFLMEIEEIQLDEGLFAWTHLPKEDTLDFYRCKAPRLAKALSETEEVSDKEE